MNQKRRYRLARTGVIVAMAASVPVAFGTHLRDLAPPLHVTVQGEAHLLPANTTLLDLALDFSLKPKAGDLLDVQGLVLRPGLFPGSIDVNGQPAYGDPVLPDGSVVTVVDGKDQTEPVTRHVIAVPGGVPPNPQFALGSAPGEEILTVGRISGKYGATRLRATGPLVKPDAVALTFDDGPGPYSASVLAILQRFDVRATFFVIGFKAEAAPDMVKQEAAAGMTIGNHSWDHPNTVAFNTLTPEQLHQEVGRTSQYLASIGVATGLFRPPGGSYSNSVIQQAADFDCRVVLWNVDPRDWVRGRTAAQITSNVLANVAPGSIVEMHDGGGDRSQTVKALPAIIRGIEKKGLTFVALTP